MFQLLWYIVFKIEVPDVRTFTLSDYKFYASNTIRNSELLQIWLKFNEYEEANKLQRTKSYCHNLLFNKEIIPFSTSEWKGRNTQHPSRIKDMDTSMQHFDMYIIHELTKHNYIFKFHIAFSPTLIIIEANNTPSNSSTNTIQNYIRAH